MKTKYYSFTWALFLFSITAIAQNPVTTLEHNGETQVFYGQDSFVDAYNASSDGDILCLSAGYFTAPGALAKGITVIGSGHFPDSVNIAKRTYILSGLTINQGADSLHLEGLYINGNVNFGNYSISYVKILRCRLSAASFSSSESTPKNNCSFEECFIFSGINFAKYGVNLLIKHCIICGKAPFGIYTSVANIDGDAVIDGNIILRDSSLSSGDGFFTYVYGSLIQNNVILQSSSGNFLNSMNSNTVQNNLFNISSVDFGNNFSYNNYIGVTQSDIFVNQSGNSIDYTHDYHLKNPATYLGTDGSQVGIYGSTIPFKTNGLPFNPQIISKSVASETDTEGNLQVSFKVKAQEN